jgi:uncharacterized membrane protein YhaH (DUF805 family)
MNIAESIKTCMVKFAVFDGRASRSEFWWFYLVAGIVGNGIFFIDDTGYVYLVIALLLGLPSFSAGARRLHDVDKSGWWQLLWITFIGGILVMIWQAQKGNPKPNKYGEPELVA